MSAPQNQQTVGVAATLAGEAQTRSVTYPITGDPETDLVSGIVAVIDSKDTYPEMSSRVLKYLSRRYREAHKARRRWEKQAAKTTPVYPPQQYGGMGNQPGIASGLGAAGVNPWQNYPYLMSGKSNTDIPDFQALINQMRPDQSQLP